jgi:ankyrin repeat protein
MVQTFSVAYDTLIWKLYGGSDFNDACRFVRFVIKEVFGEVLNTAREQSTSIQKLNLFEYYEISGSLQQHVLSDTAADLDAELDPDMKLQYAVTGAKRENRVPMKEYFRRFLTLMVEAEQMQLDEEAKDAAAASAVAGGVDSSRSEIEQHQHKLTMSEQQRLASHVTAFQQVAIVHGDAKCKNIITDNATGVWLIGNRNRHVGPVLEDLASFEVDLMMRYTSLSHAEDLKVGIKIAEELWMTDDLGLALPRAGPPGLLGLEPKFKLLWSALCNVRSFVQLYCGADHSAQQYRFGLLSATIPLLADRSLSVLQRQLAYVYALGNAERIVAIATGVQQEQYASEPALWFSQVQIEMNQDGYLDDHDFGYEARKLLTIAQAELRWTQLHPLALQRRPVSMMEVVVGIEPLSDEKHKHVSSAGFLTDTAASGGHAATAAVTVNASVSRDNDSAGDASATGPAEGSAAKKVEEGLSPAIARVLEEELPGLVGHLRVGGSAMVALIGGTGTGKTCKLKRLCVRISEAQHWQNIELPNHDEPEEEDDDEYSEEEEEEGGAENGDKNGNEDNEEGRVQEDAGAEGGVRQPKPERQLEPQSQPSPMLPSPSHSADQTKRLFLPVIIPMLEFASLVAERGLRGAKDDLVAEYFKCKYGKWSGTFKLFLLAKSSRRLMLFFDGYNELPSHQLDILHYVNLQLADQRQPLVIFASTPATMPRDLLKHCLILQLAPLSRAQQLQLLDVAFRYHAPDDDDDDDDEENSYNRYASERQQNEGGSGKALVKSLTRNANKMQFEAKQKPTGTGVEGTAEQPSSPGGGAKAPRKPNRRSSLRQSLNGGAKLKESAKEAKEALAEEMIGAESQAAAEMKAEGRNDSPEAKTAALEEGLDPMEGPTKADAKSTDLHESHTAPQLTGSTTEQASQPKQKKQKKKRRKKRPESAENYIIGDLVVKRKPTTLSGKARAAVVDRLDTTLAPYAQVPALLLAVMSTTYGKTSQNEHKRRKMEEWERKKRQEVAQEAQRQGKFATSAEKAGGKETVEEGNEGNTADKKQRGEKTEEEGEVLVTEEEGDTEVAAWKDGLDSMLMPSYELARLERRAKTIATAIDMVGTVGRTGRGGETSDQNGDSSVRNRNSPSAVDYSREIEETRFLERLSALWSEEAMAFRRLVRPGMKQLLSFLAFTLQTNRRYVFKHADLTHALDQVGAHKCTEADLDTLARLGSSGKLPLFEATAVLACPRERGGRSPRLKCPKAVPLAVRKKVATANAAATPDYGSDANLVYDGASSLMLRFVHGTRWQTYLSALHIAEKINDAGAMRWGETAMGLVCATSPRSGRNEMVRKEGDEEGEGAADGEAKSDNNLQGEATGGEKNAEGGKRENGEEKQEVEEVRESRKEEEEDEGAKTMSLAHLVDDWWRPVLLQLSMVAPPMAMDAIVTTIVAAADPSTIQQLLAFAAYNSVPRLVSCLRANEVPMPMTFAKPQGGGMLPLHHACSASLPSIAQVRALLAVHPKGVCQPDKVLHRLPLHYACDSKHTTEALVKSLLVEYPEGAKQVDDNGRLPFHYFSLSGSSNEGVFHVLHTANPGCVKEADFSGMLPLHLACKTAQFSEALVIRLTQLEPGAARSADKDLGRLPLHYLCRNPLSTVTSVKLLLDLYPSGAMEEDDNEDLALDLLLNQAVDEDGSSGSSSKKGDEGVETNGQFAKVNDKVLAAVVATCKMGAKKLTDNEFIQRGMRYLFTRPAPRKQVALALLGHVKLWEEGTCHRVLRDVRDVVPRDLTVSLLAELPYQVIYHHCKDRFGRRPLHWACGCSALDMDTVFTLIEMTRQSAQQPDENGMLPVHWACQNYAADVAVVAKVVEALLEAYPEGASLQDASGKLPLHYICARTNTQRTSDWSEQSGETDAGGASEGDGRPSSQERSSCADSEREGVDKGNPQSDGPFDDGQYRTVTVLLDAFPKGARQVDYDDGMLALHYACKSESPNLWVVEALLEANPAGAEQHDQVFGMLPLHCACKVPSPDERLIRTLLSYYPEAAAEPDSEHGHLPLHLVCRAVEPQAGLLRLLLDAYSDGAAMHDRRAGRLPLHYICESAATDTTLELAEILLDSFPRSVEQHDETSGRLPLHWAARSKRSHPQLVSSLAKLFPQGTKQLDDTGMLPLHYICQSKRPSEEAVRVLLNLNPDSVSVKDSSTAGQLPIQYACTNEFFDEGVVRALLEQQPKHIEAGIEAAQRIGNAHAHYILKQMSRALYKDGLISD